MRTMETIINADDLESRAKACGLSVATMCARAGIHRATWQRFKARKHALGSFSLERLVDVVARAEEEHQQGGEAA